jgi:hypothetical protein
MIHPSTLWSILTRGILMTLRNYLTERMFGLQWRGFGRFTTGVSIERLRLKRQEYHEVMTAQGLSWPLGLEFERMYSIQIKAVPKLVEEEIAKFGERERIYFTPKLIQVRRTTGQPHQPGCVIQYRVWPAFLSFSLSLEKILHQRYFIYRVLDGFAQGGVLIFEIETDSQRHSTLSIYVAFDFYRGKSSLSRVFWWVLRCTFPAFIHDVLWNHSLCRLKDNVESNVEPTLIQCAPQPA